jgi:hypothetical protein
MNEEEFNNKYPAYYDWIKNLKIIPGVCYTDDCEELIKEQFLQNEALRQKIKYKKQKREEKRQKGLKYLEELAKQASKQNIELDF